MKKFLFLLMMVFMTFMVFANGESENGVQTLTVLTSGDTPFKDGTSLFGLSEAQFLKDYPGVEITWLKIDLSNGSAMTMDAMLAAGSAPNIYIDTMVRASKYMVPEFALPLDNYIDISKYPAATLAAYRKDGKLMALPQPGGAQGMLVNLDIMKEIGYTVPKNWTIDDFLEMAQLVKDKYAGKKWATGMFAANQSGDYLLNNWFASFGVQFYKPGNYDVATIADTGGAKVYQFYQLLVKNGFAPPNAAALNDDDYAAQWQVGNLAATAFFPSWTAPYFKAALDQGQITKPFEYVFLPFPRAVGVQKVPTYISNGAIVVRNTGTYQDKLAARLADILNSAEMQNRLAVEQAVLPNRVDATAMPVDPHVQEVLNILKENGVQDVGLTDPRFTERRALQFPILQEVLNFKMTPEEAIALYQKKLSAVTK